MPDYQQLIASECDTLKALLLAKNADYGNAAFEPIRVFSNADPIEQIRVRIDDKLNRIRNRGEKAITEDTVMDLIGYLVLLRVAEIAEHIGDDDEVEDSKACWHDMDWWETVADENGFEVSTHQTRSDGTWCVDIVFRRNGRLSSVTFWSDICSDPWYTAYLYVQANFIMD